MRKIKIALIAGLLLFNINSWAQIKLNNILGSGSSQSGTGLSNEKIIKGLREALTLGTEKSASKASLMDGFYKNPLIKIPFPPEAKQMEQSLSQLGMSSQVNSFVKTLNRAAEDAAKKAAPIFVKAITTMSITDGLNILRGGNNAATEFLKQATTQALKSEFKPVVAGSLKKVEITRYWKPLVSRYNQIPFTKRMNPDLEEYVTVKAIDGLFKLIAEEELKIRKDPVSTGSNLLQEVFGKK